MNLRKWASNSQELMKFVPEKDRATGSIIKVLCINWNLNNDTLSLPELSGDKIKEASTKHEILQAVVLIFGPFGYFTPTVIEAKLFIQELWTCKFYYLTMPRPKVHGHVTNEYGAIACIIYSADTGFDNGFLMNCA